MGRVLGAYGVRGWVRVEPFTEQPDGLGRYPSWWLKVGDEWREMTVAEFERHGRQLVARLGACATRDEAARYRGCEVGVPREALPELKDGEVYQADLIGMKVVNRSGAELGLLEGMLDNGAHQVMRVRHEGGERLVPFLGHVVERVDLEARVVRVDWEVDW
jgi:16S rRNA processing protein RimM